MKSKTLDIIALYLLTGNAAYKVATVKSFILYRGHPNFNNDYLKSCIFLLKGKLRLLYII